MSSSDTILLDCSNDSSVVVVGSEQCSEGGAAAEPQQKLTKNQQKKRARMEWYRAGKPEWRRKQRERQKERKRARKADGQTAAVVHNDRPNKLNTMNESKCRVRVAVDMAYDDVINGGGPNFDPFPDPYSEKIIGEDTRRPPYLEKD
ncbi:hypothetical protein niasHT_030791 [Heterodera trifolii]|uniref:Uncharacterized protein n=1 Tax=Heterodera trifolii TaxID=157864 RepID=A0ABD2HUR6_9BILA